MSPDKTARMANQIAAFFDSQPGRPAEDVAAHVNAFWEPRMRARLLEEIEAGTPGLHPLVRAAAPMIRRTVPA